MQKQQDVISSLISTVSVSRRIRGYEDKKDIEMNQNNPYASGSAAAVDDALFDEFFKQARPSSSLPGGYRNFLASDCLSVVGSRRRRAEEMRTEGSDLAQWVSSNPSLQRREKKKKKKN